MQTNLSSVLRSGQAEFGDPDPCIAYNRVFFALLRIQREMMPAIEKGLREMGIADPVWYEILLATEEAGASGIPMITLQKRLNLAQYAVSRHVARIEKAGLLRREASGGAGRGQTVYLTPAAVGLHSRIWQVYMDMIQAAISPRLSTEEAYQLLRMLNRLYGEDV